MKGRIEYRRLVTVLAILLGFAGQTIGPLASKAIAAAGDDPVIEVQTFGSSYGEWSERWWQWALSIPAEVNPVLDTTGANCAEGQVDDVWFLAGTFGGTVERTCDIPEGKPIFFPVVNVINGKPLGNETLLDLRRVAADFIDSVDDAGASINSNDGMDPYVLLFDDLQSNFRVRSPSFTVKAPPRGVIPPGLLKVPGNVDPLVSDGIWLLLSPLDPELNPHTISFIARIGVDFVTGVEYTINVIAEQP